MIFTFFVQIAFSFTTTYDMQGHSYQTYQVHKNTPLVVLFHGCRQNADDFYTLTNGSDRQINATIVYANQNPLFNVYNCWNWFYSYNQAAFIGSELDTINHKILSFKKQYSATSVHLVGFSSGAGIVSNLVFTYPKTFKSALIHSGPAFGLAKTGSQAITLLKKGDLGTDALAPITPIQTTAKTIVLVQGKKDKVVNPNNQNILVQQFSYFLKIPVYPDQRKRFQEFSSQQNRIIIWRLPTAHEWSGGNPSSEYSAPNEIDILDNYYSSVVGI
ncbi:MAG: hypothetical protein KDD37_03645 [Bdellovibrionales bacterium]|nr:hypothetical protein [Bdellovibrionales bacterium]